MIALPLASCFVLVRLIFAILKQIRKHFWLKLFDLDNYSARLSTNIWFINVDCTQGSQYRVFTNASLFL